MIKYQEKLFKVHASGDVGSWEIIVIDNGDGTAQMERIAIKKDGAKPVVTKTPYTVGKNIGRANETTPLEQAVSEGTSRATKKLDEGYVKERPAAGAQVTNSLGFLKPMLATAIEKVKGWEFPVYVQPKFDGHRLLATVQDGEVILYSRQGKVVSVDHVRNDLQRLYDTGRWSGATLDGEIYKHGETLQKISSLVKKPKRESRDLTYHVYDIMADTNYGNRLSALRILFPQNTPSIALTETKIIAPLDGHACLDDYHARCIAEGYEGTIVRHGDLSYQDGKRSKGLMKKKDFQDAEFKITGIEEGKPYIRDNAVYRVPVFQCLADNGEIFNCTAPGTMEEKHTLFEMGEGLIGQLLTVKFFNLTPDGLPFLPVALRLREDI